MQNKIKIKLFAHKANAVSAVYRKKKGTTLMKTFLLHCRPGQVKRAGKKEMCKLAYLPVVTSPYCRAAWVAPIALQGFKEPHLQI